MDRGPVFRNEGREYVTVEEFCRRVDISRTTFEKRARLGIFPITRFDGKRQRYLDWELAKRAYDMNPCDTVKVVSGKKNPNMKGRNSHSNSFTPAKESAGKAKVPNATIPPADSGLEMKMEKIVDIENIDPRLLDDCTINGIIDWDLTKKKITALTYAFDLDVKKGKYIERVEVQKWAIALAKILESALASIPNRYVAILEAELLEITQKVTKETVHFTEQDKARIRKHMDSVAPDIFKSIQQMLGEFNDNE